MQTRRKFSFKAAGKFLSLAPLCALALALASAPAANAAGPTVLTVPWDAANLASPHTTYPLPFGAPTSATPTSEVSVVLGATVPSAVGSTDSFTYTWTFGDGTSTAAAAVTNPYDISATHQYPYTDPVGTQYSATVTVTDTYTGATGSGTYLITQQANSLQTRVNVAIDKGLWYLHQAMYHVDNTNTHTGTWESCSSFPPVSNTGYACSGSGSLTATNVQAFEVDGHFANGPATDPYTNDVSEGLASIWQHLTALPTTTAKTYTYNPAVTNFGCLNGTAPEPSGGTCSDGSHVLYNSAASSCNTPPCVFTFDGNSNGQMVYSSQQYYFGYEQGMYIDALVASGTSNATAPSTAPAGIANETYQNIVQDIVDFSAFSQYSNDADDVLDGGYNRGQYNTQGGGWWYQTAGDYYYGDDNSVSQWYSIGLIAAQRGFGITVPPIVIDANNMWVTASQALNIAELPVKNPTEAQAFDNTYGGFGYNGALNYSDVWSPFATTPSGMVQMSLDGIGRTINNADGDAGTNAADQRFNNAETFYADNFCNAVSPGGYSVSSPRSYYYGMFSFTKAMLLHNPVIPPSTTPTLTPIQYLRTQTPGVFTTNTSVPANTIDWYAALSPTNGGTDPCDGVAQTIIDDQQANPNGSGSSFWYGDNYNGSQDQYETAWAIIMLQRTVFVNCVNNLGGKGVASGVAAARIDLTWTGIPNVTSYEVRRSSTSGGPYTEVGSTTTTDYSDRTGLTNGDTYYYVLQPLNGGGAVCQSNQTTITVPKKSAL